MSGPSNNPADFVSSIEASPVIYTDDDSKPQHTLSEYEGGSPDINKGFGGKFVWLRIRHATKPEEMVNHIWRDYLDEPLAGRDDDLSKGAGGLYRYLQWSHDMRAKYFVSSVMVWRPKEEQNSPPAGWAGKTDDINKGRGGNYLYLIWKVREFSGPKP
ncbi:hypothetical protein CSAL01_08635 [Colletotrichum salicis]|uniref:Uncharacterized protein n=1 Tax=Colletotrichum salicis TaxID=1209931 RepID=A0A135S5F3_9PEZI|nr:hypothetical protein CSAL01_08635 [Colletotrichum salicis]